jgi:4-hydroxybenzoate polyprenyltransferase
MTLLRLFAVVFIGIVGREMTMDINDIEDDEKHGVRTVPVVYGRRFASTIAVLCSLCVLSLGVLGPLHDFVSLSTTGGREAVVRRLAMAALGGLAQLRRSWQVLETEGRDTDIVDVAVNEGLLTVIIIMASFV